MGEIEALAADPRVAAALAFIRGTDDATVADMIEVTGIAAPSGSEAGRGRWLAARFAAAGLVVRPPDDVGNIVAARPVDGNDATVPICLVSHLDTVFAADTDLTVRQEDGRVYAPGISDNGRGLAAIVRLALALDHARIRTRIPIAFIGSVGEEGMGDLRGVKHLLARSQCSAFIAVDGAGVGRIVHRAVGSRRFRITITGPGGHSWNDRGAPHPIHALSRALAEACAAADHPRSSFSVGRIEGGTGINVIPVSAHADIDIRSEETAELDRIERAMRDAVASALLSDVAPHRSAADGRVQGTLQADITCIGDRPGGMTSPEHALVTRACDATRHIGVTAVLEASSTDANVAMSLGIPAVSVGAGGNAGGMHTTEEWYSNEGGAAGIERLLLLTLAHAGIREDQSAPSTVE